MKRSKSNCDDYITIMCCREKSLLLPCQERHCRRRKRAARLCFGKESSHRLEAFRPQVNRKVIDVKVDVTLHYSRVHLLAVLPAVAHHFISMCMGISYAFADAFFHSEQRL